MEWDWYKQGIYLLQFLGIDFDDLVVFGRWYSAPVTIIGRDIKHIIWSSNNIMQSFKRASQMVLTMM